MIERLDLVDARAALRRDKVIAALLDAIVTLTVAAEDAKQLIEDQNHVIVAHMETINSLGRRLQAERDAK